MIVYNTTFHVDKEIVGECLAYLKEQYIPQAAGSGFLHSPRLMRVMNTEEDEGVSFSVQFHVKNVDTLNYWLQREGAAIHRAMTGRFGQRLAGFSTLLEELDV